MTEATHRLFRTLFLLCTGVWAWVMVCYGPRLILELPHAGDVSSRWRNVGCAVFMAAGIFVFLFAAGRCFPLASRRVKLVCEIAPWIALGGFVIGGLV